MDNIFCAKDRGIFPKSLFSVFDAIFTIEKESEEVTEGEKRKKRKTTAATKLCTRRSDTQNRQTFLRFCKTFDSFVGGEIKN